MLIWNKIKGNFIALFVETTFANVLCPWQKKAIGYASIFCSKQRSERLWFFIWPILLGSCISLSGTFRGQTWRFPTGKCSSLLSSCFPGTLVRLKSSSVCWPFWSDPEKEWSQESHAAFAIKPHVAVSWKRRQYFKSCPCHRCCCCCHI